MSRPVLLWDVMGTLVHDPFFSEMPAFFGVSFDAMLEAKHPRAWVEFEVGARSEEQFLDDFFLDRRPFDRSAFMTAVVGAYRWLPGMEELLRELHASGSEMHVFSNYPSWYRRIEDKLRLSRYLEWSFVSCRTGFRKPDPDAYRCVVDQLDIPPGNLLFIDDRQSNCEAACAAGIEALRFQGVDSLRGELARVL
ncbi:MAG: HAD-IA family hydrolase [Polyangiales bacterium]